MPNATIAAEGATAASDAGFTLIEVVVCVALIVLACVAALGVIPSLVRASQHDLVRDAATSIARSEIERIRAATAYDPPTGPAADHTYALATGASFATTAHVHRALCGATQTTTDVAMNVGFAYAAATDTVTVSVQYPRSPCDPSVVDRVVLSERLAPSALAPGTTLAVPIDDPAQQ